MAASTQPVCMMVSSRAYTRYSGNTNNRANSPAATMAAVRLPQAKVGTLNSESSRITGRPRAARLRCSHQKSPSATTPIVRATGTGETGAVSGQVRPSTVRSAVGRIQPSDCPSTSAKTTEPKPTALVTSPQPSNPCCDDSFLVSGTNRSPSSRIAAPRGRLTRKIQRQVRDVVSQPPTSGPTAAAPAITAPQMPKAIALSRPRKVALTVERVAGRISAAPIPWAQRDQISSPVSRAPAAARLAATKSATPIRNISRLP